MFSSAAWLPGDISWHGINRENSKVDPLGHGTSISSLGPLAMQRQQIWQVWLAFSTRESDKGGRSAQPQGDWGNQGRMVLIPQIIVLKWKWEVSDKRGWRAVRIRWEATSFLYIPLEKKTRIKGSFWRQIPCQTLVKPRTYVIRPPKEGLYTFCWGKPLKCISLELLPKLCWSHILQRVGGGQDSTDPQPSESILYNQPGLSFPLTKPFLLKKKIRWLGNTHWSLPPN